MADTATYILENQEIFSVGVWKGDKYTEIDLDNMVENYKILSSEVKPMLHLGHTRAKEDGNPALGWATKVYRKGEKLLASFKDVPEIVYNAIKKGNYKRVSSEIIWDYKSNLLGKVYKRVLAGVALLGADMPAVTNLKDLEAYRDNGVIKCYTFHLQNNIIQGGRINMAELDTVAKLKEYELDLAKKNLELEQEKTRSIKVDAELKTYKKKIDDLVAEGEARDKTARTDDIKKYCEDMVKAGKLAPVARDILVKDIDKRNYTKDVGFSFDFETLKKFVEKQNVMLFGEKGNAGENEEYEDIGDEIDKKTKKHMSDKNVKDYSEAMDAILSANPELAKKYTEKAE